MSSELLVYMSGSFVPLSEARISIFDSALVVGDMVFEATRTFQQRPFRLRHHLERLYGSMRYAEIDCGLSIEELEAATYQTIEVNRERLADGFDFQMTHNVSPGIFGPFRSGFPETSGPTVTISCWPLKERLAGYAPQYDTGVHGVIPSQRSVPSQYIDPKAKNRSRLYYRRADHQVHRVDPDAWAVLLDGAGYIAEGTGSNVFLVHNEALYSPEGRNILRGVTRGFVLELARELGIPVHERNLEPYDLLNAEEAFFTSTPFGIMPMTRVDGLPVGSGTPGPVTQRLLAAFGEHVGVDLVAQARGAAEAVAGGQATAEKVEPQPVAAARH
ncbi:MAG: branched-chain amino acid aminotransferase [Dehalococcoidia bacterium]|nr:branched-chain amino acid aminotransferase [Dehalococcoidia bacterium]